MALTRMTRLQAVNIILTSSQLSPVESLVSGDLDAEKAEQVLDEVTLEVLTTGWHWNTLDITLSPDTNGNIILSDETLKADATDRSIDVTLRGTKLFDKRTNSFTFTSPIEMHIVVTLEFDELPQSARRYIALKSSRLFQARTLGDQQLSAEIFQEERIAWAQMIKEDVQMKDYNHIRAGRKSLYATTRRRPDMLRSLFSK